VQSTSNPPRSPSGFQPGDLPERSSTGQPISPEELTSKDRCPARLHDIEGAMLEYYAFHRELPPTLNDLHSVEPTIELTCPESHLPYVYVPAGLRKPGGTRRIVLHDPVHHADGTRWCIMFVDTLPGKGLQTLVVQLPEPLFRGYE
jgi:hypothetical protein